MNSRLSCFRRSLCWLLLLSVGHLPVPCFDADWEVRGEPIDSVFDASAWCPLLLGLAPADDIDRGPFREQSDSDVDSPFGAPFVSASGIRVPVATGATTAPADAAVPVTLSMGSYPWRTAINGLSSSTRVNHGRSRCVMLCVLRV
ncbi:hypothetical protein GC176_01405 [bacterium]|nr:hypothetical protein [bacterium]